MSFNVPTDFASRPVAVIGAGTLGRRIGLMFAAHGAEVKIYDLGTLFILFFVALGLSLSLWHDGTASGKR